MLKEMTQGLRVLKNERMKNVKRDQRGNAKLTSIVGICIGLFVAAIMAPLALTQIANATLTGVDPAVGTMFSVLLPVLGIIAIIMVFVSRG
jgi:hypothetical protein